MKYLAKLTLVTAACATLGTLAAFADSAENQQRLTMATQTIAGQPSLSVAVYTDRQGLGQNTMSSSCSMKSYRLRSDAHGHQHVESATCPR